MNPVQKLKSWWRGPADPESVVVTGEAKRMAVSRDTIRLSQHFVAAAPTSPASLLATPDVLDPRSED
jgi:hypothetical protein